MIGLLENFAALGFSSTESAVYTYLLRSGTSTLATLAKKHHFTKRQTEAALQLLLERGLIQVAKFRKETLYTALESRLLPEHFAKIGAEAQVRKEAAGRLLDHLKHELVPASPPPTTRYFAGVDGVLSALSDTLSAKEKTIRVFSAVADLGEYLGAERLDDYTKKRNKAGLTLHLIRTFERDKRSAPVAPRGKRHVANREERREVRYVSEDVAFPVTMFLYDHKALMIGTKAENMALMIESKEFVLMQKRLFQLIWQSLSIRQLTSQK